MLSILIPVYNYDVTLLTQELSDQLNQLNYVYEIIILDDCSTKPEYIINNKKLDTIPNCSFITQSSNKGRTSTRLNLAKMARYEWLLFLDADVLPLRKNFIEIILKNINNKVDIIFGGIEYQSKKPIIDNQLRWLYGRKKEAKNVTQRNQNLYSSIISLNFVIQKKMCFEVMEKINLNRYGLDVLFSYLLKQKKARVLHLDNPTLHLGLEDNSCFFKKSISAIETTLYLQKNQRIPKNYKPIQRAYLFLSKTYTSNLFFILIKNFEKSITKNLNSNRPNLFLFDLYRLYYFIKIQK